MNTQNNPDNRSRGLGSNRGRGSNQGRGLNRGRGFGVKRGRGPNGRSNVQGRGRDNSVRGTSKGRGGGVNRGISRGRPVPGADSRDFVQATSNNLPAITFMKVAEYYQMLRTPEQRQAKDNLSSSADYGDKAIGYVKVKRASSICTVQAKVTPQTKVNNTPYNTCVEVDETTNGVKTASCNCQASKGNCKHQTALIFWILRRAEEPSPTEIVCYWKRSFLSTVKGIKTKTIDELSSVNTDLVHDDTLLKAFIEAGKESNKEAAVVRYNEYAKKKTLFMDHLLLDFLETKSELSCENFLAFCMQQMTPNDCKKIFSETKDQSSKAQWYYIRFGRITASKIFEVSRCNTVDGSLVASVMGSRKFKGNAATQRGQKLEIEVFELLKQNTKPSKNAEFRSNKICRYSVHLPMV